MCCSGYCRATLYLNGELLIFRNLSVDIIKWPNEEMSLIPCYAQRLSRIRPPSYPSSPRWSNRSLRLALKASRRLFNDGGIVTLTIEEELANLNRLEGKVEAGAWDEYKTSCSYSSTRYSSVQI